ncbi:MAG: anaerobic ribonucleoside-triphosphate reductase activating protein [Candidatus Micrarchaeaceae archaeon]|jgi:pyruvate formate lyase activating enzyme
MQFGGIQKTTLVDFPGRVATILFTSGCNMRCHYCYNPDLVFRRNISTDHKRMISYLLKRKKLIDSVVITGGEPTIWTDLPEFIETLHELGFHIKLDTNGSNPGMLRKIINKKSVEYIAMDIKAPWNKYESITGTYANIANIKESMNLIKDSKIDYEFRTTAGPNLTREDLIEIATQISPAKRWFLQPFMATSELVNMDITKGKWVKSIELGSISKEINPSIQECTIR